MTSSPDLSPAEAVEMMAHLIALEDDFATRQDAHPLRTEAVGEVRAAVHALLRMNTDILTGFQDSAKGELIACHEHLRRASDLIASRQDRVAFAAGCRLLGGAE